MSHSRVHDLTSFMKTASRDSAPARLARLGASSRDSAPAHLARLGVRRPSHSFVRRSASSPAESPIDATGFWDGFAPRSQRDMFYSSQDPFGGLNYDASLVQLQIWFLAAMVLFFCVLPKTWRQQVVAWVAARCGCGATAAAAEPTEAAPKPTEATPLLERDVESAAAEATELKAPPAARPKLYYIDNLRTNVIFTSFNFLTGMYFMALFFFISGVFTPRSFERKGWTKFLEDRMLRIALPCVFFYTILGPFYQYRLRTGAPWTMIGGPAWFLKSLAFYNIIFACTPRALPSTPRCPPAGALLLGGFALGLLYSVLSYDYMPVLNSNGGLQKELYYVTFFIAGCAAGQGGWLESIANYSAGTVAFLRGVVILYCVAFFFFTKALWSERVRSMNGETPINDGLGTLFSAFSGIYVVAMSLSLLQGFHQYCNTSNALTRALSSAAYTVYVIHPFAIAFAVWTLFKIYKAEGYDISQKMDLNLGGTEGTQGEQVHAYVPDATWPSTYWVNSAWDDDNERFGPDQNSWGLGRLWGYKSWGGWLWLCFAANVVVWPVAYAIKQLPGVRSVM